MFWDGTQVVRLGDKHFNLPIHFTGPEVTWGAGVVLLKILSIFYFMGLFECMSVYQVHGESREVKRLQIPTDQSCRVVHCHWDPIQAHWKSCSMDPALR